MIALGQVDVGLAEKQSKDTVYPVEITARHSPADLGGVMSAKVCL